MKQVTKDTAEYDENFCRETWKAYKLITPTLKSTSEYACHQVQLTAWYTISKGSV